MTTRTGYPAVQPLPQARQNIARLMHALQDAQRLGGRTITAMEGEEFAGALLTLDQQAATILGLTTSATGGAR